MPFIKVSLYSGLKTHVQSHQAYSLAPRSEVSLRCWRLELVSSTSEMECQKVRCAEMLPFPRIRLYISECVKDTNG